MHKIKKRSPFIAFILSANIPGLGQMYNGQLLKGILLICGVAFGFAILYEVGAFPGLKGMFLELAVALGFYVYLFCDSIYIASKRKDFTFKKYNRWYYYIIFSACFILASIYVFTPLAMSHIPLEIYKIPSNSMKPALSRGDIILVDKSAYDTKTPQAKDVVIFKAPDDPKTHCVKRIVATPGEKLEIRLRSVYINGKKMSEYYVAHTFFLPRSSKKIKKEFFGPITIPPKKYFLMGDNRDNSHDSRNYGYVERSAIFARPLLILFSLDAAKVGMLVK